MLACEDRTELQRQAQTWCNRLALFALFGLKLNVKKTEYLTTDMNEHGPVKINGTELSRVTSFKYLGSTVTSDGSLKLEVNARIILGTVFFSVALRAHREFTTKRLRRERRREDDSFI
ncbi:unnamed protein product [Heligmosomoides polygyrus]|uniref:Reverse transcriptase domain-containing protein n=1 Tax=Heligmosomoides polygyrus TaxID=6339 RepID=A0A183F3T5_HELPZ|nr:unnamed protein product [Heligmosomoides polygyrus]